MAPVGGRWAAGGRQVQTAVAGCPVSVGRWNGIEAEVHREPWLRGRFVRENTDAERGADGAVLLEARKADTGGGMRQGRD